MLLLWIIIFFKRNLQIFVHFQTSCTFSGNIVERWVGAVVPLVSRFDTGEYQVALLYNPTCAFQYFSFTVCLLTSSRQGWLHALLYIEFCVQDFSFVKSENDQVIGQGSAILPRRLIMLYASLFHLEGCNSLVGWALIWSLCGNKLWGLVMCSHGTFALARKGEQQTC